MKKRMRVLLMAGLITSITIWNADSVIDGMRLAYASEEDDIIMEEASPEILLPNNEEEVSEEEVLPLPEESGVEIETGAEDSVLNLFWDEDLFTVPWDFIDSLEEEEYIFLESYEDKYVICFIPEEKSGYALYFSETVEKEDVRVYEYDADAGQVKNRIDEDEMILAPDGSVLAEMENGLGYIIVLDHAEAYPDLGLVISRASQEQMIVTEPVAEETIDTDAEDGMELLQETIAESETETVVESGLESETEIMSEQEPETESGSVNGSETELMTEQESESETVVAVEPETDAEYENETEQQSETGLSTEAETETVQEPETDTEISSGMQSVADTVRLESVKLLLDDGLEQVPVALLPYLDGQEVVKIRLQYSDGSEQFLTETANVREDSLGNSCQLTYEDTEGEDGSVSRIYSLKVVPAQEEDGTVSAEPETVIFRKEVEDEIENIPAQEKSRVRYYGKKNWILVQSVPNVTGRYAMESFGRGVEELYYCAAGESEAVKADTSFELKEGVTYTFLLKLEK